MSINVIQSSDVNVLVEGLIRQSNSTSNNIFEVLKTQHFVVPNKAMQKWVEQRISEETGISANKEFYGRIQSFQWSAYQSVHPDREKVRQANLPRIVIKWRIYETLRSFIQKDRCNIKDDHPLFPIISRIYESSASLSSNIEALDKRNGMLYWIADQVSKLFINYITYRGQCHIHGFDCMCDANWLSHWGKNKPLNIEKLFNVGDDGIDEFEYLATVEMEEWQRWLWFNIFEREYQLSIEVDREFWSILEDENQVSQALKKLPDQLIVFTILELPPSQLNFLRRIGEYIDVFVYHFNPSQEYWADSVDSRWKKQYDLGIKERFIQQNQARGKTVTDEEIKKFFDDFSLNFNAELRESRHPLLTRMGKQARDHFSLLSTLSSGDEGTWYDLFYDEQKDTLLGKVQSDILNLLEPQEHQYEIKPNDSSIRINACHSSIRQVEVLKEQIIQWLAEGDLEHPRRLDDIIVYAPNIKNLEPVIRSVFAPIAPSAGSNDVFLPIKISGVVPVAVTNAWTSLCGRINLLKGRFNFEEFSDWLTLKPTLQLYGLDHNQAERILTLLKESKFKRGFDADHLKLSLASEDYDFRFTFKYAVERLMLGIAIGEHIYFEDTLCFDGLLPSDYELVSVLIRIRQDLDRRRDWLNPQNTKDAQEWLDILMGEVKQYQDMGELNLIPAAEVIQSLLRPLTLSRYHDNLTKNTVSSIVNMAQPLSYIMHEINYGLDSKLEISEPSGQITFCQLGSIRPIPYKLVVMMNLDSGVFPSIPSNTAFDLMRVLRQQIGDRSRLDDDQGAFLDAILMAQDNLWMFYNAFDVDSGLARQPSSLLQEFVDHLSLISRSDEHDSIETYTNLSGLEIPSNLIDIFKIHTLQPFDASGFGLNDQRLKNQWFKIAQSLQLEQSVAQPWLDQTYTPVIENKAIPASRWISDMVFPAQLFLNAMNIKNIQPAELAPDDEPLFLSGLDRYAVREFVAGAAGDQISLELLDDKLPVSKLRESVWNATQIEHQRNLDRLVNYADSPTVTKTVTMAITDELTLSFKVPEDNHVEDWVVLKSSSAYGEHRAKAWLEYLLWIAHLNQGDMGANKRMVVIFNNKTVVSQGVSSNQALSYLKEWVAAWTYGQQQPLILPAKLLLACVEKGKKLEWVVDDELDEVVLKQQDELIKVWTENFEFSADFPLVENRANRKHRDWAFILRNSNSVELLKQSIQQFSQQLYAPFFDFQDAVKD